MKMPHNLKAVFIFCYCLLRLAGAVIFLFVNTGFCTEISDYPMETATMAPSPNIMFIFDNSGSMDWEFVTKENNGTFSIGGEPHEYLFADPGDNNYTSGSSSTSLKGTDREYWKSQWQGYNRIYYDQHFNYTPWQGTKSYTMNDAGLSLAFSNPIHTGSKDASITLKDTFHTIDNINIANAHYYACVDKNNASNTKEIYLVTWEDTDNDNILDHRLYYKVETLDDKVIGLTSLFYNEKDQKHDNIPNEIQPGNFKDHDFIYKSDKEDLQNFSNWYTYYRRRELAAKAAIAQSIFDINNDRNGIYAGLYTINRGARQPVLPINFKKTFNDAVFDQTETFLNLLYEIDSNGATPLRAALLNVGRYYDQDDGYTGNLGASPFKDEAGKGACQQAFAIIITDGYYNGDDPKIGNQDGDDNKPYSDSYSNTLADIAMKYYDTDLADNLPDNLAANNYDDKKTQHMITYSISFGVDGTIDLSDMNNDKITDNPMYKDDPYFLNPNTPTPIWPDPDAGDAQKIDDLLHAAVNGRGEFFSAYNVEELISSFNFVLENLSFKVSSGSSVSISNNIIDKSLVMYQAAYTPPIKKNDMPLTQTWQGDVTAYLIESSIDIKTGAIENQKSKTLWSAGKNLQSLDWDVDRRIVTYNGYDSIIPFRYSNLTKLQKTMLNNNPDVVDYIRGKEILSFRQRQHKLGDIVHSAPHFVSIDDNKEKFGIVFVGSNDGMLHAFDAKTGVEIFAYIPHLVFDHLIDLTKINYNHKFYVDAAPFSRKIIINSNNKVLLTGGLKKGGKGYFCLDITKILSQNNAGFTEDELATPAHNQGIDVLWEYPELTKDSTAFAAFASDDDLGYSFSDIFIVQSYKSNNDPDNHNWAAVFGNGYDSVNGSAILYILNAYTGELIKKIDTGAFGNNGLSSPALIDINNDEKVDYVYAGDLLGNMWKFDLTDSDPANWKIAYSNESPVPLFSSPGQPVTSAPDIMYHCSIKNGYMVIFGTGKFIGKLDKTNNSKQSIYGILDIGFPVGKWDESAGTLSKMPDALLLEQTKLDLEYLYDTAPVILSNNKANWIEFDDDNGTIKSGDHIGWYFDLPAHGERVVKDVMIHNKKLIAMTFAPDDPDDPDDSPCASGGSSIVYEVSACDGTRLFYPQFDINKDNIINKNDMVMIQDPDDPASRISAAPSGKIYNGFLYSPVIVTMPDKKTEMKIFGSSKGISQKVLGKAEHGFYYWRAIQD